MYYDSACTLRGQKNGVFHSSTVLSRKTTVVCYSWVFWWNPVDECQYICLLGWQQRNHSIVTLGMQWSLKWRFRGYTYFFQASKFPGGRKDFRIYYHKSLLTYDFSKDLLKYIKIYTQMENKVNTKVSIDFEEFCVLLFNQILETESLYV